MSRGGVEQVAVVQGAMEEEIGNRLSAERLRDLRHAPVVVAVLERA